jgi:hypothetical protein
MSSSILFEARQIAGNAIALGLISAPPKLTGEEIRILRAKRQPHRRHRREDFPAGPEGEAEFNKARWRFHQRLSRQRRAAGKPRVVQVSRLDFPDTPEGYQAFMRAYRKAWLSVPGNLERNRQATRDWIAKHRRKA